MSGFVDARLHIAVRPQLEYAVPELGRAVVSHLLGEVPLQDVLAKLAPCLPAPPPRVEPSDDAELANIRRLGIATCMHLSEYVGHLVHEWKAYVDGVRSRVTNVTQRIERDLATAKRVRDEYRARNPDLVDAEYRRELQLFAEALDRALDDVRKVPPPVVSRPQALCDASEQLKEAFARSYGTVPTPSILALKKDVESELVRVQVEKGQDFVSHVRRMLAPTEP